MNRHTPNVKQHLYKFGKEIDSLTDDIEPFVAGGGIGADVALDQFFLKFDELVAQPPKNDQGQRNAKDCVKHTR